MSGEPCPFPRFFPRYELAISFSVCLVVAAVSTSHGQVQDDAKRLTDAGVTIKGKTEVIITEQCSLQQDEAIRLAVKLPDVSAIAVSFRVPGNPKDRAAADTSKAITDAGLVVLAQTAKLKKLRIDSPRLTDTGLGRVAELTSLVELAVQSPEITDAGVGRLASLKNLKLLSLAGNKLTASWGDELEGKLPELEGLHYFGLPHVNYRDRLKLSLGRHCRVLKSFPKLNHIHADHCFLDGDGLAEIARISNLKQLHIGGLVNVKDELGKLTTVEDLYLGINTSITDESILSLAGLSKLKRLGIGGITDAGMPVFEKLPQLESLNLVGVVSGKGMQSPSRLNSLRSLDFSIVARADCSILADLPTLERLRVAGRLGDDDIQQLAKSPSLKNIVIHNSQVTRDGVAALQKRLPKASIQLIGDPVSTLGAGFDINHMRHLAPVYEKVVGEKLPLKK